ncbi:MAG: hypothetical protein KY453_06185 [Gemmatimonadetes bacterium]|nr:hypothetical protein [Gemmatimonadota bacterium]
MGQNAGKRIRVIIRWVQIKDKLEPFFKEHGEFRFRSRVTSGDQVSEAQFPEEGHWEISDLPRFSKVDKIDKVLFEGPAGDSLVVELFGEEIDQLSANDQLDDYRREFTGPAESWVGFHQPGDEGSPDPENMPLWRVGYEIELV